MDKYSIHARLYPIAISLLPLGVLHFAYFVEIHNYLKLFTSLVFYTALIYLLSQLGRDNGKRKEKALWNSWGGPPVEQLLSFENIEIDLHTKQRYHQKMLRLIPIEKDTCVLKLTDEYLRTMYKSWSKYLITHTRDTKKFDLIYKELVNYGFRRNLWGLKSISISLLVLCIILNYLYNVYLFRFLNPVDFDFNFYITEVMLTTLLAFWTFIINRSWVKIPAAHGRFLCWGPFSRWNPRFCWRSRQCLCLAFGFKQLVDAVGDPSQSKGGDNGVFLDEAHHSSTTG